jgi:glycerophosphoryl diester phosphodiesterase
LDADGGRTKSVAYPDRQRISRQRKDTETMRLIASGTGRCNAPELTRIAFISAFVAGADGFRLPLRLTSDKRVVVFEDETTDRLTGTAGAVSDLTLKEIRALDIGANFTEADGSRFSYSGRVESFGLLLDALPPNSYLVLELKPEPDASRRIELASQAAAGIANRARQALTLVFAQEPDALAEFRKKCPGVATALYSPAKAGAQAIADAIIAKTDAVVLPVDVLVNAQGVLTPLAAEVRATQASAKLPLGALSLTTGPFPAPAYAALNAEKAIWGLVVESLVQAAVAVRPGWLWVDEQWGQKAANGEDVNTYLWRLGYAKYNPERYCHVFPDNGIHVDIKPFAGSTSFPSSGNSIEDELQKLRSRTWDALKDWPFYSGGGAGFVPGIEGDFSAEVDVESETAQQATTVEMAVLNADPGAHRPPWIMNTAGKLVPNPPASFRDKHTFYDPHGAPPYVGVEHDEDDGWRINWNLGTDYDSNQYGRAVGDGKLLTGRMRLDRRGAYFAAYYRATGKSSPEDWVCLGVVRNESLNPKIYLRLAGKRWRQEDPNNPSAFMPVIPNHFTFKNFTLTRFP